MAGSNSIAQRLRRGHAELGTLRFALIALSGLLVVTGAIVFMLFEEPDGTPGPLHLIGAMIATLWAAERLLQRSTFDRVFGLILAAGAALLWAQRFGIVPYPPTYLGAN